MVKKRGTAEEGPGGGGGGGGGGGAPRPPPAEPGQRAKPAETARRAVWPAAGVPDFAGAIKSGFAG